MVELSNLEPSESYNISATIVSSNYDVTSLSTQIFTTLKHDYVPEKVTELWVDHYTPVDNIFLNVVMGWKPTRGKHNLSNFDQIIR